MTSQVYNLLWIPPKILTEYNRNDPQFLVDMPPPEIVGVVWDIANRNPEADIRLWIDSRRMTEDQLQTAKMATDALPDDIMAGAIIAEGRPANLHLKDLRDIPEYTQNPFFSISDDSTNWRGGTPSRRKSLIWHQIDAAKVLVCLQPDNQGQDYEQVFYSDMDIQNLNIASPEIQTRLARHGLILSGDTADADEVGLENQLFGFNRSNRDFFERLYRYIETHVTPSLTGNNVYAAYHMFVRDEIPQQRLRDIVFEPMHDLSHKHIQYPGQTMQKVTLQHPVDINVPALAEYADDYGYKKPGARNPRAHRIYNLSDDKTILECGNPTETGFTTLGSDFPPNELAAKLRVFPKEVFANIMYALTGTHLELPIPFLEGDERLQAEKFRKLKQANSIGSEVAIGNFEPEEARGVIRNELGFTDATSERPVLGSPSIAEGIILAVYDPNTHSAALAHITPHTELNTSINHLFHQLSEGSRKNKPLQVHLIGGDNTTVGMAAQIVDIIEQRNDTVMQSVDLCVPSNTFKRFAIDSRSGQVFTDFDPIQLDIGENLEERRQAIPTTDEAKELTTVFNHLQGKRADGSAFPPINVPITINFLDEELRKTSWVEQYRYSLRGFPSRNQLMD